MAGPDFLQPQARPGWLAWAWCATAGLVLGVAGWEAAQAWTQRDRAMQAVQALQQAAAVRAPASAASAAGAQPRTAAPAPWWPPLAHPWQAVWVAAEAATVPGVAWLALEHSLAGALRLEGQAPDEATAQQAAQRLARADAAPGHRWAEVTLVRTDRVAGGQRFELSAQVTHQAPSVGPATP